MIPATPNARIDRYQSDQTYSQARTLQKSTVFWDSSAESPGGHANPPPALPTLFVAASNRVRQRKWAAAADGDSWTITLRRSTGQEDGTGCGRDRCSRLSVRKLRAAMPEEQSADGCREQQDKAGRFGNRRYSSRTDGKRIDLNASDRDIGEDGQRMIASDAAR
jgi:hypothetical protein